VEEPQQGLLAVQAALMVVAQAQAQAQLVALMLAALVEVGLYGLSGPETRDLSQALAQVIYDTVCYTD
jgi:hypothetical protein